jgi:hypothetical protein
MLRYTQEQLTRMTRELEKRSAVLRGMSPWPDINYMVDESWARTFPYGQGVQKGKVFGLSPMTKAGESATSLPTGEGRKKRELNARNREGNAKITLNLALFFQKAERARSW